MTPYTERKQKKINILLDFFREVKYYLSRKEVAVLWKAFKVVLGAVLALVAGFFIFVFALSGCYMLLGIA